MADTANTRTPQTADPSTTGALPAFEMRTMRDDLTRLQRGEHVVSSQPPMPSTPLVTPPVPPAPPQPVPPPHVPSPQFQPSPLPNEELIQNENLISEPPAVNSAAPRTSFQEISPGPIEPPADIPIVETHPETPHATQQEVPQPFAPLGHSSVPPAPKIPEPTPINDMLLSPEDDIDLFAVPPATMPPAGMDATLAPKLAVDERRQPEALSPEDRLTYGKEPFDASVETESPLRPEELMALETEAFDNVGDTENEPAAAAALARISKPLKLIAAVLVGATVLGGVAFLATNAGRLISHNGEPVTPPAPPVALLPEPSRPELVLTASSTSTLTVPSLEEVRLELQEFLAAPTTPTDSLRAILLKVETSTENRFLTFDETVRALNILIPNDVRRALNPSRFTLFVYGERDTGNTRVGFAVDVQDTSELYNAATAWEATMADDFEPLLRSLGKERPPATPQFLTNMRRELTIRYLNFPEPDMTLDYAVDPLRKLFVVTTSRDSMFAAIDALSN